MNKKMFSLIFAFLFIALLLSAPLCAESVKKVALLPFQIHSKSQPRDLQNGIYEALANRLRIMKNIQLIGRESLQGTLEGKSINDALAVIVGKESGAAFVITGSLTELGDVIGVDVRILDVNKKVFFPLIFAQGKGMDGLDNLSARLIGDILVQMGAEQRIARIEYKGNRRIESNAVNQIIKSVTGGVFSDSNIAEDIKAIYKMGYFTDVAVQVTDLPEGKVITFILQEKGMITSVKIQGNKALSTEDIESALTVKARQTLNQEKIKADVPRIKDLYDNKGYYNAEITDAIEKDGEKDARVIFAIRENERIYIRSMTFSGNVAYTDKELRKMMTTQVKGFFSFFTDSGILKKEQLKQDIEKINENYLNNGYIYAQVGEPEISHDNKGIYVKIPITEGKQYQVGKVEIAGDELKVSRAELLAKLQINNKRYYAREAVLKDMDFIQQACNDEGYAYAEVTPRTTPQDKDQKVDVIYQIAKSHQVYFNRITITGNTKTRDKVIRRLLSVVEGDLYSKSKLKESYMAINRLRYFEEVDLQAEKAADDTLTDINIRVKEKPTGMFSIGAGYSAQDSLMFMAQISQQNLFGRGQSLSLRASLGGHFSNYELSFIEPWLFDIPLWSKSDLWNLDREYDTYSLDSKGAGFTLGYPLWGLVTGYLGYKLSMDNVRQVSEFASSYIKRQEGETTTSTGTITLVRDSTDDYIFPTKGSKNSLSVQYAGGFLQGDASFIKYEASSAWFFPLPWDTVFGVRGRGGFLQETESKEAPVYERFYLGGINSIRGLRTVGPVDPVTGDVIGGLTMLNFNAEFIFPLIKNAGMKGVVFYDTGNSWESGYNLSDMRRTAGTGIRWYSPIGPLRLEWGYVLDPRENEPRSRWEFTIGMFM